MDPKPCVTNQWTFVFAKHSLLGDNGRRTVYHDLTNLVRYSYGGVCVLDPWLCYLINLFGYIQYCYDFGKSWKCAIQWGFTAITAENWIFYIEWHQHHRNIHWDIEKIYPLGQGEIGGDVRRGAEIVVVTRQGSGSRSMYRSFRRLPLWRQAKCRDTSSHLPFPSNLFPSLDFSYESIKSHYYQSFWLSLPVGALD
jgi:hypothetical protein